MSPGRRTNRVNLERVKEQLRFYSSYDGSQRKTRECICFECSQVQLFHKAVTGFGAGEPSRSGRTPCQLVVHAVENSLRRWNSANFGVCKILGNPCWERDPEIFKNRARRKPPALGHWRLNSKAVDSILLCRRNQARWGNRHMAFVVVVELHFVIRLGAGDGLLAPGAEPRFAG